MELEEEIRQIHARNKRVEVDKAWETSITRRLFIMVVMYTTGYVLLRVVHAQYAAFGAMVTVAGYFLSTLTVRPARKVWERVHAKRAARKTH